MKNLLICIFCLTQANALLAQQKFTLHGKVTRVTKSKNIHVGSYTVPIKDDGTFELTGEIPAAEKIFIHTDSSSLYLMWLEQGDYLINCVERRDDAYKYVLFNGNLVSGPAEAKIYDDFQTKAYIGFVPGKLKDHATQQQVVIKYTDSILKKYPNLKSMPGIIAIAYHYVGDAATKKYLAMLKPEMRRDPDIVAVQNELNRKEKIATGIFDDFAMKTADGNEFKLSSLKNKKVIIVDFWATWCAPCRAGHPKLVELYKKYADKGLEIVSISLDTKKDDWLNSMKQDNISAWVNVSDLKAWQSEPVKNYFIDYIPFCLTISGDRKIIKVYQGGTKPTENDILSSLK